MEKKKLVILGGGITGLSAAYYAQKMIKEKGYQVDVTLLEKDTRLGGKIQTTTRDGFIYERGPDSFLGRKLPIIRLTEELNLVDELVSTGPKSKGNYIYHMGRFHKMPQGLILGIPTEFGPFVKTGLISLQGKLTAGLDLIKPKQHLTEDESLGSFIERRLGKEVLENIAEPLLSGIYAGDIYNLSLRATFPQFKALEQKYRSLIIGMGTTRKQQQAATDVPDIVKQSNFLNYKNGLQTLVNGLIRALQGTTIDTNTEIKQIVKRTHFSLESEHAYTLITGDGQSYEADWVISTLPPQITARLIAPYHVGQQLNTIKSVSVANIILAYNQEDLAHDLEGAGFVISRKSNRKITACTWTSSKWAHTAPPGKALIRCYVGHAGHEDIVFEDEDRLIEIVKREVKELMGIDATPLFTEVNRLPHSMPQYPVGHLDNIQQVRKEIAKHLPGVLVTGAGYGGVGIPDCIAQGKQAAEQILQQS